MGFFDSKYIVEYEYSNGFFSGWTKAKIEIDASGEYDAKDKAKKMLKQLYKNVQIKSARKK